VQNFLKIGSGVPELEDLEKCHFPLKAFIALTTVLRYRADCDNLCFARSFQNDVPRSVIGPRALYAEPA